MVNPRDITGNPKEEVISEKTFTHINTQCHVIYEGTSTYTLIITYDPAHTHVYLYT